MPAAIAVGLMLVVAAIVYWRTNAGLVKTDNAQTAGGLAPISAQVAGTVIKVNVTENQQVKTGDVLVELDPADYRLALSRAQAGLVAARAQVSAAEAALAAQQQQFATGVEAARAALEATQPRLPQAQAQLIMQEAQTAAQIAQAQEQVKTAAATVQAAQSNLVTAQKTLARDKQLVGQGAISAQQLDVDQSAYDAAQAGYQSAQNTLRQAQAALSAAEASRQQVAIARSGVTANQGQVAQAQAQLQQAQAGAALVQQRAHELGNAQAQAAAAEEAVKTAELNLSRTRVLAPADGWVTNKTVEPGQVVQPNQPLLSLTLAHRIWIVANIKETLLGTIRVGDPVRIRVDAFRGRTFNGRVESIGKATGSSTALLPPDNATGNFVKVVQLVPVRIALDEGAGSQLPIGLSVEVAIDTRRHTR
jgi:membrane fusion protein (multidrug efflux system)